MNEQRILRCAPNMSITRVGRDYLLELHERDLYCVLDEDAFCIMQRVDGTRTIAEVCDSTPDPQAAQALLEELTRLGVTVAVTE